MVYADFSGREIVKELRSKRFRPVDRTGSHVKLRYEHPETDEVHVVTVPLADADRSPRTRIGLLPNSVVRTTSRSGSSG